MYPNGISPQDIVAVVRQGQREGFAAGVIVSAGVYVFAKIAGPSIKEFLNEKVTVRTRKITND